MKWTSEDKLAKLCAASPKDTFQFEESDYMSGDGIQTAIFGPVFWAAIHMVSFNFPVHPTDEQKRDYENWLLSTGRILPCRYCRDNFSENVRAARLEGDFDNRDRFSRFCYRLHDRVNKMLNKETPLSFEEVRDMYEGFRSRCMTERQKRELANQQQELGCVVPMHDGTKGKCVIQVVPRDRPDHTFSVSDACRRRA